MLDKKCKIAVVGATGNVGRAILQSMSEKNFPLQSLTALASTRSANKVISYGNQDIKVESLENHDFRNTNIALFAAGNNVSQTYVQKVTKAGCIVVDSSSYWRMDTNVPLVIPEVNGKCISTGFKKNIIANPNCIVIPLVMVLQTLKSISPIKRVVLSTYQSVSGAGHFAMKELYNQSNARYTGAEQCTESLPQKIAFNVFPQIGTFDHNGNTGEETKILEETHKIFNDTSIMISATCVRVPVFIGHSISLNVEFINPVTAQTAKKCLKQNQSLSVIDEVIENVEKEISFSYITPLDCVGSPLVYISRIRHDNSCASALNMWIVCDNLRKGAALNAVQIAEKLINTYL